MDIENFALSFLKTPPSKSGYLKKQVGQNSEKWIIRYFVLERTNLFYLNANPQNPSVASIKVIDLLDFSISDPIKNGENFTFILVSQNKESENHILEVTSNEQANEWVQKLRESILKNREEEKMSNDIKTKKYSFDGLFDNSEIKKNGFDKIYSNYCDIQKKESEGKIVFNLMKELNSMKIYQAFYESLYVYFGEIIIEKPIEEVEKIFKHEDNQMLWSPFLVDIEQKNDFEYHSFYNFNILKSTLEWQDFYLSKFFRNEKDVLILRKSLGRSFIKNKSIRIFPLSYLKFAFNINLHAINLKRLNEKTVFHILITLEMNFLHKILIQKIILNYIESFALINSNFSLILEKIDIKEEELSPRERFKSLADTEIVENIIKNISRENSEIKQINQIDEEEEKKESFLEKEQNEPRKSTIMQEKVVEDPILNKLIIESTTPDERKRFLILKEEKHLVRKAALNEKELKVFIEIKQIYNKKNITYLDDNFLIRFLISRDYNLQATQKLIEEYIVWRQENHIDDYDYSKLFSFLLQDKIFQIIGRDKSGRPVIYGRGQHFVPAKLDLVDQKSKAIHTLELLCRMCPNNLDQFYIILDAGNVSTANINIHFLIDIVHVLLLGFSERLYRVIIPNTNWFIKTVWRSVRPFLKEVTRRKFNLVGTSKEEIFQTLSEDLDINVIPKNFGGENPSFSQYN